MCRVWWVDNENNGDIATFQTPRLSSLSHTIIYNRIFRHYSVHYYTNLHLREHSLKYPCLKLSLQYHVCAVDCKEYHLTVSRNKRNDILFIGKLFSTINLNNAWDSRRYFICNIFSKTVSNRFVMFYMISSVMLFVSVLSVCFFNMLVLE